MLRRRRSASAAGEHSLTESHEVVHSTPMLNDMSIRVFSIVKPGSIVRAVKGEELGTIVSNRRNVLAEESDD